MHIIVGLGNPEEKYFRTFHNMGYNSVGDCASRLGLKFKKKQCEAYTAQGKIYDEDVILARPVTYMNNSGRAVKQLLKKYRCGPESLIVIYDDYDLPKGKIRIRKSGSAGTHNGMRSVVSEINSTDFVRIRIGIRDPDVNIPLLNYVLSEVREEDYELFVDACNRAADAALAIASGESCDAVMTEYN